MNYIKESKAEADDEPLPTAIACKLEITAARDRKLVPSISLLCGQVIFGEETTKRDFEKMEIIYLKG